MTKQEQLVADITAAVISALDAKLGDIACPLEAKERKSVRHLYGLLKDIGDGDTDKGIRQVRKMFGFVSAVQTKKNVITGAVFTMVILGMTGAAVTFVWCSIQESFRAWVLK